MGIIKHLCGSRQSEAFGRLKSSAFFVVVIVCSAALATPTNIEIPSPAAAIATPVSPSFDDTFTLSELDSHPLRRYAKYLQDDIALKTPDESSASITRKFLDIVQLYRLRQSVDDNFTLRVNLTTDGSLLEVFELDSLREATLAKSNPDWGVVDKVRQRKTREIVDRYEEQGFERRDIAVRWGRKNQVLAAREHEQHLIEYEIALAEYYGLSLLSTELGTVETFNNDRLVSRVGARGRYQIMPAMLRQYGVNRYDLRSRSKKRIRVYEERHPLLTMDVSMLILKAYTNAVGHEIPGVSAYHTGPFNILHIFETYLTEELDRFNEYSTVALAYMWGLTDGYPKIRSTSSFRSYSRGYVPSGLGSLQATEDLPIDTTRTLLAEEVQLKQGKSIYLSTLVKSLEKVESQLIWRLGESESLYERFRLYNPHISLGRSSDGSVPKTYDVKIVSSSKAGRVRFFLPRGASHLLSENGINVFDLDRTRAFDHDTYSPVSEDAKTEWDYAYEALISDLEFFTFSQEKVDKLNEINQEFRRLAKENPTHYRQSQYALTSIHRQVWNSLQFERFLQLVEAARGKLQHPPLPPIRALERLPYAGVDPWPEAP